MLFRADFFKSLTPGFISIVNDISFDFEYLKSWNCLRYLWVNFDFSILFNLILSTKFCLYSSDIRLDHAYCIPGFLKVMPVKMLLTSSLLSIYHYNQHHIYLVPLKH